MLDNREAGAYYGGTPFAKGAETQAIGRFPATGRPADGPTFGRERAQASARRTVRNRFTPTLPE